MKSNGSESTVVEKSTYCRICEPLCGMVATVENGRLVGLRPDQEDPHSKGFCCVKGLSMQQVVNDPDRITVPMRRVGGPGEFEPTTWDQALGDIAARMADLRKRKGPLSLAIHEGNPPYFSWAAVMWAKGFTKAIGTKWFYGINSEDGASFVAATKILYGHCAHLPIPDTRRTDVMLVLGANPWVSKGSTITDPRIRDHMLGITERGGRVFVVDPARTATAKAFEHIPILGGTDAWFLLSVLHVLIDRNLYDKAFVDQWTTGFDEWKKELLAFPPEATEQITKIPAATVYTVAEAIGRAKAAVVYGRTGTCTQKFGTMNNVLQNFINIITGNLQRPGGHVFAWSPVPIGPISEALKLATFGEVHTRVSGLPDSYGWLPTSALPEEITTPGEGQIRGMLMIGSNGVVTGPSGNKLAAALQELEVFAALDIYINETNKYADYLLPCTTMYEREDTALHFANRYARPSIRITDKVVDAPGECREEWVILEEIAKRMGLGGAYGSGIQRTLAKMGIRMKPRALADLILRTSQVGDLFGLRKNGWSWAKLAEKAPRGVVFHEFLPLAPLKQMIKTEDHRIPMADPRIMADLERLKAFDLATPEFPLRMIGMREMTSHNSWMHNASRLMPPARRHAIRMNPADAEAAGVCSGDEVTVSSVAGSISTLVRITDDIIQGTIAVPHGWGHSGNWRRANAAGGANSNLLSSEVEGIAGMSVLNGIPVRVTAGKHTAEEPVAAAAGAKI